MKKITSVLIIMLSCLLILSGCTGDNIENSGQNVNDGSYTTSVEYSQIQDEEKHNLKLRAISQIRYHLTTTTFRNITENLML